MDSIVPVHKEDIPVRHYFNQAQFSNNLVSFILEGFIYFEKFEEKKYEIH